MAAALPHSGRGRNTPGAPRRLCCRCRPASQTRRSRRSRPQLVERGGATAGAAAVPLSHGFQAAARTRPCGIPGQMPPSRSSWMLLRLLPGCGAPLRKGPSFSAPLAGPHWQASRRAGGPGGGLPVAGRPFPTRSLLTWRRGVRSLSGANGGRGGLGNPLPPVRKLLHVSAAARGLEQLQLELQEEP